MMNARPQLQASYDLSDLLGWVEDARCELTKDPLIARLPYDRFIIAGLAQALPELTWGQASAQLGLLDPSLGKTQPPDIASSSQRSVGLVFFQGNLICPRGEPETLISRLLRQEMENILNRAKETWDGERHKLINVRVKDVDKAATGYEIFGPIGLPGSDATVMEILVGHRARYFNALELDHATPMTEYSSRPHRI